jgi:hypothetical protein
MAGRSPSGYDSIFETAAHVPQDDNTVAGLITQLNLLKTYAAEAIRDPLQRFNKEHETNYQLGFSVKEKTDRFAADNIDVELELIDPASGLVVSQNSCLVKVSPQNVTVSIHRSQTSYQISLQNVRADLSDEKGKNHFKANMKKLMPVLTSIKPDDDWKLQRTRERRELVDDQLSEIAAIAKPHGYKIEKGVGSYGVFTLHVSRGDHHEEFTLCEQDGQIRFQTDGFDTGYYLAKDSDKERFLEALLGRFHNAPAAGRNRALAKEILEP